MDNDELRVARLVFQRPGLVSLCREPKVDNVASVIFDNDQSSFRVGLDGREPGQNLLGQALTEVREILAQQYPAEAEACAPNRRIET